VDSGSNVLAPILEKDMRALSVKPIPVTAHTNLSKILVAAADAPVRLERNGVVYLVACEHEENIWAGDDPERVRERLHRASGLISPDEADRLEELVDRGREEGTRPPTRP
jgi:hypothetical protein